MASGSFARSGFRAGVVVSVSAVLLSCLVSCGSQAQVEFGVFASELRAASDSDLLVASEVRLYEVSTIDISTRGFTSEVADRMQHAEPSGYLVLDDGVMTEASLSLVFSDETGATFVLSEPTVVFAEGENVRGVYAEGVITVTDFGREDSGLWLVPGKVNGRSAVFDVSFDVPDRWRAVGGGTVSTVSARLSFVAG